MIYRSSYAFFPRHKARTSDLSPVEPRCVQEATQVTPLFIFDGLDFDGDRIVNLRVPTILSGGWLKHDETWLVVVTPK